MGGTKDSTTAVGSAWMEEQPVPGAVGTIVESRGVGVTVPRGVGVGLGWLEGVQAASVSRKRMVRKSLKRMMIPLK
jgi:hypothetical protein